MFFAIAKYGGWWYNKCGWEVVPVSASDKARYWFDLAKEDIEVAQELYNIGKLLYSGFLCHLAVEKALKAKIEFNGETPLKTHNLIRLADIGGVLEKMTDEQKELLNTLNPLQIEARYPAYKQNAADILSAEDCAEILSQARRMVLWTETQL